MTHDTQRKRKLANRGRYSALGYFFHTARIVDLTPYTDVGMYTALDSPALSTTGRTCGSLKRLVVGASSSFGFFS